MNKKIIIISTSVVGVVAIAAVASYFIFFNNQTANQNLTNFGPQNFNNANFRNLTGKVISVSSTDLIIDTPSAQSDVVTDNTTRITGNVVVDKSQILTVGNTVNINFQDNNGVKSATKITKIDITANANQQGMRQINPNNLVPSIGFKFSSFDKSLLLIFLSNKKYTAKTAKL